MATKTAPKKKAAGKPAPKAAVKKATQPAIKVASKKAAKKAVKKAVKLRGIAAMNVVEGTVLPAAADNEALKRIARTRLDAIDASGELYHTHFLPLLEKRQEAMRTSAIYYHSVGERMFMVRESLGGKAASTLGTELGLDFDTCRKASEMFTKYKLERIQMLTEKGITWGHLRLLVAVPSGSMRIMFENRVISQGWSPARLGSEISAALVGHTETRHGEQRGQGRPHNVPETYDDSIWQLTANTRKWCVAQEAIWPAAQALIAQMDAEGIDTAKFEKLNSLYQQLGVMRAQAFAAAQTLNVLLRAAAARLNRAVTSDTEVEAAADTPIDDAQPVDNQPAIPEGDHDDYEESSDEVVPPFSGPLVTGTSGRR